MSAPAKQSIEMADFPGLLLTSDERDFPPGAAAVQTNVAGIIVGELTVRRGIKEVVFEDE